MDFTDKNYQVINFSDVTSANHYAVPFKEEKEQEINVPKEIQSETRSWAINGKHCYNIVVFLFAAIALLFSFVSLALFLVRVDSSHNMNASTILVHRLIPPITNDNQNLSICDSLVDIEILQSNVQTLSQEVQHQATALQDSWKLIRILQQQINESMTHHEVLSLIENRAIYPRESCKDLSSASPSGYYHIGTSSGIKQVYCDTNRTSCNCTTTGGWMRVANIDMTNSNQNCPPEFKQITRVQAPLRTCGRPDGLIGCVSTTFPAHDIKYSHVCGRVKAYQFGNPEAFHPYIRNGNGIDTVYAEGVSITHGQSPRQHIWTFVGGRYELTSGNDLTSLLCPCSVSGYSHNLPPFIGQDYFCDAADVSIAFQMFPNDPLWDGQGCGDTSTCCEFNNPPWFCKQLPQPTTDDIELRICADIENSDEDFLVENVEIYTH